MIRCDKIDISLIRDTFKKKNKLEREKDYVQKSILSKTCDKVDKMW